MNDVIQYEHDYVITTRTRHRTPIVRTTSIANMGADSDNRGTPRASQSPIERARLSRLKRASMKQRALERTGSGVAENSSPEVDVVVGSRGSESSDSAGECSALLWLCDFSSENIVVI